MDKTPIKNPLLILWNIFCIFSAALSIPTITDTLIQWEGFLLTLTTTYQNLIYPIVQFPFSWFPFQLPEWLINYYVFGLFVVFSVTNALNKYTEVSKLESIISEIEYIDNPIKEWIKYLYVVCITMAYSFFKYIFKLRAR